MAFKGIVMAVVIVAASAGNVAGLSCGAACRQASQDQAGAFEAWVNGPVQYLLSDKERRIAEALVAGLGSLDESQLAAFRHWVWERRDPTPGTPANEFRDAFKQRVDYANKEFGSRMATKPGWQTPRGVLYVLLGPPTRIGHSAARVYAEFDPSDVEVWIYEIEDGPALELPFVAADEGVVLLHTPDNVGMQGRLNAALAAAAMDRIVNRELPFTGASPLAEAPVSSDWPVSGSLARSPAGLEGQISIPLSELYGSPHGDDLRIDLGLELEAAPMLPRRALGTVTVVIGPQDFDRWHDQSLTLALWLPELAGEPASAIVLREMASGRTARFPLSAPPTDVARAYEVEHLLGLARLLDGTGAAFAFVPSHGDGGGKDGRMWVLRPPHEIDGVVIADSAARLQLVRQQRQFR